MAQEMVSMETVLDQERREILALLENPLVAPQQRGSLDSFSSEERVYSSFTTNGSRPEDRLNAGEPAAVAAKDASGVMTHSLGPSMLDIHATAKPHLSKSAHSSPTVPTHNTQTLQRARSDASSRPPSLYKRDPGYLKTAPGSPPLAKRPQVIRRPDKMDGAVRSLGALEMSMSMSKTRDRAGSLNSNGKSKSPHKRLSLRSDSPSLRDSNKSPMDEGRTLDLGRAYRKLSDANLGLSKGSLSLLPDRSRWRRSESGSRTRREDARLAKDYVSMDGDDTNAETTEYESSSDEQNRGRRKGSRDQHRASSNGHRAGMIASLKPPSSDSRPVSQLAAAEEEQQAVLTQLEAADKSPLDPAITITPALGVGDKLRHRHSIHPNTSFDQGGTSGFNTPVDSEEEADITDIKRAQNLSIIMTPVISTPATKRCVRTIYRGDFPQIQKEASEHNRRVRKYLVATDLSDEAQHALEWTIGTVLRDGDTLLAIYCVDEELGIAPHDPNQEDHQLREQASAISASTRTSVSTPILSAVTTASPVRPSFRLETHSSSNSPMGRGGKTEQERNRAVQDITDRVSKLLRKTKLQVKIVIEVIHCKSPKHLITEVIDFINPTLVILGSRGRSALKGVILGSFSNYLVTKSSVPVMVARKRLRKHSKYKRPLSMRLANNLSNPAVNGLALARVDEFAR